MYREPRTYRFPIFYEEYRILFHCCTLYADEGFDDSERARCNVYKRNDDDNDIPDWLSRRLPRIRDEVSIRYADGRYVVLG